MPGVRVSPLGPKTVENNAFRRFFLSKSFSYLRFRYTTVVKLFPHKYPYLVYFCSKKLGFTSILYRFPHMRHKIGGQIYTYYTSSQPFPWVSPQEKAGYFAFLAVIDRLMLRLEPFIHHQHRCII